MTKLIIEQPLCLNQAQHWSVGWALCEKLAVSVARQGTQLLPGSSFNVPFLTPLLQKAVSGNYISPASYAHVVDGLRFGFNLSIDVDLLRSRGKKMFANYSSALDAQSKVSESILVRVKAFRTYKLGNFERSMLKDLPVESCIIFPMGAVVKQRNQGETSVRPFSDHTRTGLNPASFPGGFSLRVMEALIYKLSKGKWLRMSDVAHAFTLIPLRPDLWRYFMFVWYNVDLPIEQQTTMDTLYMHLFADFGSAGAPECWYIILDVLVSLARMENILTLPMEVYVDDLSHIGDDRILLDEEGEKVSAFLSKVGAPFNNKTRNAAQLQLCLGLWWNTLNFTITLEEMKLSMYLSQFKELATLKVVNKNTLECAAGRGLRAVMTMQPGSKVLLASTWSLLSGLRLPHHKIRTTMMWRQDWKYLHDTLQANAGRGYYRYDDFLPGGEAFTDASRSKRRSGGGYVHSDGRYNFWHYGSASKRKPIDYLEGDAVLCLVQNIGDSLSNKLLVINIDNSSFQLSASKSWSHADRLNSILKELLYLSVKFNCILIFNWISTVDNLLADALSRDDEAQFIRSASAPGSRIIGPLCRHPNSGNCRTSG